MDAQLTDSVFMVRPAHFGYNEETASTNVFQRTAGEGQAGEISQAAVAEFDRMADLLTLAGVQVHVAEDTSTPVKTDAVFPNNWVSFHADGTVVTYPMLSPSRRLERREDLMDALAKRYRINRRLHLEDFEQAGQFLEGTGSLVPDREHRTAYAAWSARTHEAPLDAFCRELGYQKIAIHTRDTSGMPVYHTNVIMAAGEGFAVWCQEVIPDNGEQGKIFQSLRDHGKEVLTLNLAQVRAFAGNLLQLTANSGERLIILSQTAQKALDRPQIHFLERHGTLIVPAIPVIEHYGGGSVRCMLAELFLPELDPPVGEPEQMYR